MSDDTIDCVIIGGGPAGLTAALYLARFHLAVTVIDGGDSRAALIPCSRNVPGYPGGIAGPALLRRMARHATRYGAQIVQATATVLARDGDAFRVTTSSGTLTARSVLLATGVHNRRPDITERDHADALRRGLLRYCPICDGYEVTDRRVGVIGTGAHGMREALFLRGFTADVTLIAPDGPHELSSDDRATLDRAGVALADGPSGRLTLEGERIALDTAAGRLDFASVYPALGSVIRSDLARGLAAEMTDDGCLLVDTHQRTSVAGLYAAGDVVKGLDQISHAVGEGGVAATTIRNDLAERAPLLRAARPLSALGAT
ncbi:NAD(P)/FAD-dependent oxidoreductase [Sphingomonas sp. RT2P30]|uniref:NAD(P)/FAD-dependent oxidoreductase n=1 Tax=Parasphingomonas halimpatiens TaxID=3096162 RepID=UPI002FC98452